MAWPRSTDYIEAVQNLHRSMDDEELRAGRLAKTPLGLPMVWSGGFADVYKIHNASTGSSWALKCFTKEVTGQEDRYKHISAHLDRARLPFMVDFRYLSQGIRVQGEWYPALKMHWVEGGLRLNEFVEQYLNRPRTLKELLRIWVKMADRLRQAAVGHCDLQHGNVLMVPRDGGSLALRLIDYDGVHVPSLAGTQSSELGHPAFQHPQRSRERVYSAEVDRFSHLAIYTSIHCLTVGREELWKRFNNGENLLFREEDYRRPADSEAFRTLWKLPDADSRALVGRLALACEKPLDQVPLLDEVADGEVYPLLQADEHAVDLLLGSASTSHPVAVADTAETSSAAAMPEWMQSESDSADGFRIQTKDVHATGRLKKNREKKQKNALLVILLVIGLIGGIVMLGSIPSIRNLTQSAMEVAKPSELPESYTNAIGMQFKLIPAGEFMMGSPDNDPDKEDDETPQHQVRITNPFYLGIHEVTQEQYEKVMDKNPSQFKGPSHPVEQVSWEDARQFCEKLSGMDGDYDYRLPTEAEWEYACRAGTSTRYSCGDKLDSDYAWFRDNSSRQAHPVGEKRPNAWGLYDMHGNVWEWCQDRYDVAYYKSSPPDDPTGPSTGSGRVDRGGGWSSSARRCWSAYRGGGGPDYRIINLGFRVALVPAE